MLTLGDILARLSRVTLWQAAVAAAMLLAVLRLVPDAPAPAPASAPDGEAGQQQSLTGVLERIRQDVGFYEALAARWRGQITPTITDPALTVPGDLHPPDATHPAPWRDPSRLIQAACPVLPYDFDIVRIKVTLGLTAARTASTDSGLKVPFAEGSLSGGGGGGSASSSSRRIVLNRDVPYDLAELEKFVRGPDYVNLVTARTRPGAEADGDESGVLVPSTFPIAATLVALRRNLLRASEKVPCLAPPHEGGEGDTMQLHFRVSNSVSKTLGFEIVVISKQASQSEDAFDNTIDVTIAPHGQRGSGVSAAAR